MPDPGRPTSEYAPIGPFYRWKIVVKLTGMALPPRILIVMYRYPNGVREARYGIVPIVCTVPILGMG